MQQISRLDRHMQRAIRFQPIWYTITSEIGKGENIDIPYFRSSDGNPQQFCRSRFSQVCHCPDFHFFKTKICTESVSRFSRQSPSSVQICVFKKMKTWRVTHLKKSRGKKILGVSVSGSISFLKSNSFIPISACYLDPP